MGSKKISQLTGNTNPSLTGVTVFDDSTTTYKVTLNTLRNKLVDSGSHFFTGSQFVNGNLVVTGSIIAQDYIISSSVIYQNTLAQSGSTIFGNSLDDTHQITGSLNITGSLIINGSSFSAATSGTSGTSGSSGTSGTSGTSGSSGTSGTSGSSGISGDHGDNGSSGTSGTSGSSGSSGSSGTSGTSGTSPSVTGSTNHIAYYNSSDTLGYLEYFYAVNGTNGGQNTFAFGTDAYTLSEPERLMVDGGGSYNIATFQTSKQDYYAQLNIINFGSGSESSTDLVLWNDETTNSTGYLDLGLNSSNYTSSEVGFANDGYLFNHDGDLYLGSGGGFQNGHVHIFGGNRIKRPQISVFADKTIGFNINIFDTSSLFTIPSSEDGFIYEFSGSVKLNNDLKIDGSLVLGNVSELLSLDGGFSGNRDFDYTSGSIFYLTGLTGNGTWNVNNVPTTENRGLTLTFLVEQGVTPYSASAFTFDSSAVTVKWVDSTIPTGSANKTDIIGLTAFRVASSWNVLGSLSSFGS